MQAEKQRILLVDDEPQVLLALEDLLGDAFAVIKTASPEEALRMVANDQDIAVVLSDQRMPQMTGDELLARIDASSDAKRILVTAFADLSAVIRAVNNGQLFAYVTKPWNPNDLILMVQKAADHFRLAQELARERRLLSSILHSLDEGIVAADREGNTLLFNPQAARILGTSERQVNPQTWARDFGVFTADRRHSLPAAADPLLRAVAGEKADEIETWVKNGTSRGATVAMTGTPLVGAHSDVMGGVAVLRDVTRQRDLETKLSQAQKMEAIGRLAGGVAHDFNNLLVVIQSYAELLREDLLGHDSKRDDLDEILGAARRAAALTKQLLAFSRSEPVQPTELRLGEIVTGIEKMLRRIIGEDIELVTDIAPSLGLVRADAGQIDQVILNLSINARDAMQGGGRLSISAQNVSFDAAQAGEAVDIPPGEYVMLAVTDSGTGMTAETQRRIFEPFFTTKDVGQGTGLGLATVYGIVQQSGGQIRVYSEPGSGTAFKLYLPRLDEVSLPNQDQSNASPMSTGSGTVLVVEDDSAVRQLAARVLRDRGYTVLEARRPSEARRICAEHGSIIDLLLTDVIMPECTGTELARELSRLHPRMRVVYMSGYPGGAASRLRALGSGAAYLEKPFSPTLLAEKVQTAMKERNDEKEAAAERPKA
ncbi:MAG TPA: response regulator [Polyangiaceae bacterium]|nr:response regulator [Polyangiaceae bacterium]